MPRNPPTLVFGLRFEMRHGDADLLNLLETSVPPADVSKVSIFAQPLARYNKEACCGWYGLVVGFGHIC